MIRLYLYLSVIIFEVGNATASSFPPYIQILDFLFWISEDFHAFGIETCWLGKVQNIEFDFPVLEGVGNFEVVP